MGKQSQALNNIIKIEINGQVVYQKIHIGKSDKNIISLNNDKSLSLNLIQEVDTYGRTQRKTW